MKIKVLVILVILVGLGMGGFFLYKNISVSEVEKEEVEKEEVPPVVEGEVEEGKEVLKKETEAPREEAIPQEEIAPEEEIKEVSKVGEELEEEPAKIAPYCGNNICENSEDRETCPQDCRYIPKEDEDVISEGNVIIIYSKKLGEEWPKLELKDALNCISVLRDKLKIDLPEPAKTRFLISDTLVENNKRGSWASMYGIENIRNSPMENIDYFRKKIEEEEVCLNLHEMTHVFVSKTPIPWWANEGLATYAEGEFDPSREKIECRENEWYGSGYYGGMIEQPYSDLSKPPGQNGEPNIYWYYTGCCFWIFIQERYGDNAMIEILQELKKNENNYSLDFLKDIVNKVLNEDITEITKERFGVPSE